MELKDITKYKLTKEHKDFYIKIRKDVNKWLKKNLKKNYKWAEYLLVAPDLFHLLTKLLIDPDVPSDKKTKLLTATVYFISPIDFIPEAFFGPVGYLDDVALAAYILNDLLNSVDPKIVKRNWAGDQDILLLIKNILINANNMIGSGVWNKIKKRFF